MKDHSISVDQDRYDTSIVAKYLDNSMVKASKKFYETTLPSDMIFTKADTYTTDQKFEKFTRESNIHYIACIGSFIYLLYTRVDFSFAVHKLEKFSSNFGKIHFEGLEYLLIYIRENNTLVLHYYDDMKDAPLTDLLIQASIKTKDQLMAFSDSSCQYCT